MNQTRPPRTLATTVAVVLVCPLLAAGCSDVREPQGPAARAPGAEHHAAAVTHLAACSPARPAADGPRHGQDFIEWARARSGDCCVAPGDRRRPSLQRLLGDALNHTR